MTYKMTTQTDKSITSTLKIPTNYTVSGAEVRQSIYKIKDIGVDIVVNGATFPKTLDPTLVNVSGIDLNKKYTPTYVRDTKGNLTLLRFN
jgi:biotin operon repressor